MNSRDGDIERDASGYLRSWLGHFLQPVEIVIAHVVSGVYEIFEQLSQVFVLKGTCERDENDEQNSALRSEFRKSRDFARISNISQILLKVERRDVDHWDVTRVLPGWL